MARFMNSLFEGKALSASSKGVVQRATGSSLVSSLGNGQPLMTQGRWDIDFAMQYGVDQIMLVYRCVDVIAQNQAGLPIRLRRGFDRDGGEWLEDKKLNRLLNFRANQYESAMQFRYRLSANLLLSRRGAFVEIVRDQNGDPAELHILPSGSTFPIPDPNRFVGGYEIRRSDHRVDRMSPEDVLWIKLKPHPTDPYQQMTPLTSLGITLETDWLARQFNRTYLANGGRQGLLIALHGKVSDEDAEEIKRRFTGGPMRAGEATVIESDGIDVKDMSGRPADTQWGDLIGINKQEMLLGFGVPESVMGNASGRTFDNADSERESFWQDTMVPHCTAISQALDPLTGDPDDDVVIAYDFTKVDVLQRQARRDREEMRAEVNSGLRTIGEYRAQHGMEDWDVTGTKILVTNQNLGIAPTPEIAKQIKDIPVVGQPPAPESGGFGMTGNLPDAPTEFDTDEGGGDEEDEAESKSLSGIANGLLYKAAMMRRSQESKEEDFTPPPYLDDVRMDEKTLEGILIGWDTQQEDIIADRLDHAKVRQGTRFWEYKEGEAPTEFKALDATYAVDPGRWVADLKRSARRTLERTVAREARRIANEITGKRGNKGLIELIPSELDRANLTNQTYDDAWDVIEKGANAQLARVMAKINDMADNGATLREIQKEVRSSIGARSKWRQRTVRNAVSTAVEGTRFAVAQASGRPMRKVWHSYHDDRVRASHLRANGQRRRMGSRFHIGPAWLMYPRDPSAPIAQTANCRCFLTYHAE